MDSGNCEGIGLVVEGDSAAFAPSSWVETLESPFQGLNLNGRIAAASALLGDVLLGALLADGSEPALQTAPISTDAPLCISGFTDYR
ncbi:MAG: hypothetical protein QM522_09880 [Chitinophagaceae bacterium]|nr:hypothetical protein [Chitinophagaceae bacterium]